MLYKLDSIKTKSFCVFMFFDFFGIFWYFLVFYAKQVIKHAKKGRKIEMKIANAGK